MTCRLRTEELQYGDLVPKRPDPPSPPAGYRYSYDTHATCTGSYSGIMILYPVRHSTYSRNAARAPTRVMSAHNHSHTHVLPLPPPLPKHSIGVLIVGVMRGLRSSLQRNSTREFISSVGPSDVVDVFALFEHFGEQSINTVDEIGSVTTNSNDKPCSAAERDELFALTVGANDDGRFVRMRLQTEAEKAEARRATSAPGVNAFNFWQFHKVRSHSQRVPPVA